MKVRGASRRWRLWQAVFALHFGLSCIPLQACIWDADSLRSEKRKSPEISKLIIEGAPPFPEATPYLRRIEELRKAPHETNIIWINDLAGAYIRAGKPKEAAAFLEKYSSKFPNEYGFHANLGTAYHLLGNYKEAEREIRRDLEINPNAHFGLERYHLALLQYLVRDKAYLERHVYVDEFTKGFFHVGPFTTRPETGLNANTTPANADNKLKELEAESIAQTNSTLAWLSFAAEASKLDQPPLYRNHWNLAEDSKLVEGICYMASLNPREPACWVMVGTVCRKARRYHLAVMAFERAIELHSIQSPYLQMMNAALKKYISDSRNFSLGIWALMATVFVLLLLVWLKVLQKSYERIRGKTVASPVGGPNLDS